MAVRHQGLKRLLFRGLPAVAALSAFLVTLLLVSDLDQDSGNDGLHYLWVLIVTGLALLALLINIARRVFGLVRKVHNEEPGARLSARWVRNFLVLSLPPALIVYLFSAYFLIRTVDGWFDVQVESALADSLQLGREFLDTRTLEVRNQLRRIGQEIEGLDDDPDLLRRGLLSRISATGPTELSVLDQGGRIRATADFDALAGLPERPDDYALLQALERGEYAAAEPAPAGGLRIRVIERLPSVTPAQPDLLLQAIYPLPDNITALTSRIEQEYYRYQNVSYLRHSLKRSFLLILSLVLLLTMFLAIIAALSAARRMVSPISRLAQATRRVAAGELGQALEIETRDELGFLARSFNDMTGALQQASQEAEHGRARLQAQGEYLETVLGSLSAGVLTLDSDGRIVRLNRAAEQILGLPGGFALDRPIGDLAEIAPYLAEFAELIKSRGERSRKEWQREIRLQRTGAPLVLLVRGSRIGTEAGADGGQVVVFDDVTVLNQAQRDAAWAEVARRLAHEVKNPLTPIRLSAERLRMKLTDRLDSRDGAMLERSTQTIISQVEALRTLVDAFGEYANEPDLNLAELQLDGLIEDVVTLYRQGNPDLRFDLRLCRGPSGLQADAGRIRQLLHNLIRNASEAAPAGRPASITITTRESDQAGQCVVELIVEDDGPGFPAAVLDQPFEPYVTHKPGGSGLGLAICRKIVEEHDGLIRIDNRAAGGARATVCLPLTARAHSLDAGAKGQAGA